MNQKNWMRLPIFWIFSLFGISLHGEEYNLFISGNVDLRSCSYKLPRRGLWKGSNFYFEVLQAYEKIINTSVKSLEEIYAVPIWFNRDLKTKIDREIVALGFNYVRDLFPDNSVLDDIKLQNNGIPRRLNRKIINIVKNIPLSWMGVINRANKAQIVINPGHKVYIGTNIYAVSKLNSRLLYNKLISDKAILPRGLITNWCQELQLTTEEIQIAFTFAKLSTKNIFKQVFQYKLNVYILPTNEYLKRYRVVDSDLCSNCSIETDTVVHRLWESEKLADFLDNLLEKESIWTGRGRRINMKEYLFGIENQVGINHFWMEVKMYIFYNWKVELSTNSNINGLVSKIRRLIILEKNMSKSDISFDMFADKWKYFTDIYDFRGPDNAVL